MTVDFLSKLHSNGEKFRKGLHMLIKEPVVVLLVAFAFIHMTRSQADTLDTGKAAYDEATLRQEARAYAPRAKKLEDVLPDRINTFARQRGLYPSSEQCGPMECIDKRTPCFCEFNVGDLACKIGLGATYWDNSCPHGLCFLIDSVEVTCHDSRHREVKQSMSGMRY
jgi:hypothetical protein